MLDPKKFADLLANSSLNPEDKVALLKLLPELDLETTMQLMTILEEDVAAEEEVLAKAENLTKNLFAQIDKKFPSDKK